MTKRVQAPSTTCLKCGAVVVSKPRGRPRSYCSPECWSKRSNERYLQQLRARRKATLEAYNMVDLEKE